jgi:hypothetical protein
MVRFLEPEHEARYRAIERALSGLSLAEASNALSESRLRDPETDRILTWEAHPMVLPVSDRLKERVYGPDYEHAVETALATGDSEEDRQE